MSKEKRGELTEDAQALLERHRLPEDMDFLPDTCLPHYFTVIANRASWMLHSMYSERYGLSVIGWRILAILGKHAPLSAKTISEMMATDAVTLSRAIEQLSGKRLIRRRVDPSDRRRQLLSLSKKGAEVYGHIVPLLYAAEQSLLSVLSDDDQAQIKRIMRTLVDHSATVLGEDIRWEDLLASHGYCGPDGES